MEALNLLSGAAIIGNLSVLESLLGRSESSSASVDTNDVTPHFHSPLTLAAAWGHLDIVRYLLDRLVHKQVKQAKGVGLA